MRQSHVWKERLWVAWQSSPLVGGPVGQGQNLSKRHSGLLSERGNHYEEERKRVKREKRFRKEARKSVWENDSTMQPINCTRVELKLSHTGKIIVTAVTAKCNEIKQFHGVKRGNTNALSLPSCLYLWATHEHSIGQQKKQPNAMLKGADVFKHVVYGAICDNKYSTILSS